MSFSLCLAYVSTADAQRRAVSRGQRAVSTRFQAKKVVWEQERLTLSAHGAVTLHQGELSLSCEHAELSFVPRVGSGQVRARRPSPEEMGGIESLPWGDLILSEVHASGGVRATFRDLKLSAQKVTYLHSDRLLKASGPIRGVWGQLRLSGSSLTVSLTQESAHAQSVEVSLPLPAMVPSSVRQRKSTSLESIWPPR